MTIYTTASPAETIGTQLIRRHHPRLDETEVRFVFRDEHQTSKGKAVLARTRLISGLNAWLAGGMPDDGDEPERFFLIEIAADLWAELDADGREALIDHELCHCGIEQLDSGPRLYVTAHDLEEFVAIVARHGTWRPEVEALVKAGIQGRLPLDDEED